MSRTLKFVLIVRSLLCVIVQIGERGARALVHLSEEVEATFALSLLE